MSLTVTLNLPPDVERQLLADTPDLGADVREAYAVELYRRGKLTHVELSNVLAWTGFRLKPF